MSIEATERKKYEAIWAVPHYADNSPGETWVDLFGEIADPKPGETVIDLGCGAGVGGKALAEKYGLKPTYLDLVDTGLKPFIRQPLWKPLPQRNPPWSFGYCCDVMEHLPPEFTMLAARNMLDACGAVFFSIAFHQDRFGRYIREPLHLTVKPFTWWRDALGEVGELIEARDFLQEGIFYARRS